MDSSFLSLNLTPFDRFDEIMISFNESFTSLEEILVVEYDTTPFPLFTVDMESIVKITDDEDSPMFIDM